MKDDGTLSCTEAIALIAAELEGPLAFDLFVERVLTIWPSRAKNPKNSVRQIIRDEHRGKTLLYHDAKTLIPTRIAMPGVRFRIPLSREEVNKGLLFAHPAFAYMAPRELPDTEFQLEEPNGHTIPVNIKTIKKTLKSPFGAYDQERTAFDLGWWYKKRKVRRNDSVLVTILDWETGRFCLQHEPARVRKRHRAEIEQHNQLLTEHIFTALEAARYESVWGHIAVLTAYARLKSQNLPPADHWVELVEEDARMHWTGIEIRYADSRSPLDNIFAEALDVPQFRLKPLSKQQARQIYRFKAALRYRKGFWRRIEIQGGQTLKDFDEILRGAFDHDFSDHLSGFWKLIRRGNSRRFREIDLGTIYPFGGEGDAEDTLVASLNLKPGDALKYVYDFGDWVEHRLELEALDEPEEGAEYPRIIAKNKPRYRYCEHCKAEGRKTVATLICIECSDMEQAAIRICEACAETQHEEHYLDDMVY